MLPLLICVLVSGFSFSFTTAYAYSSNETYSISKSNIPERGYFNGHYYSFLMMPLTGLKQKLFVKN